MYNFKDVEKVLKENDLWGKQVFFSRNIAGDQMDLVYSHDEVTIDYCPYYDYIEVFGLTEEDQNILEEAHINKCRDMYSDELFKEFFEE